MRIPFILMFFFLTVVCTAQTSKYLADLAALKSILQNTPSYKAQINGNKQSLYNSLYHRLTLDSTNNINSYQYFYNLSQLVFRYATIILASINCPITTTLKPGKVLTALSTQVNFWSIQAIKSIPIHWRLNCLKSLLIR